MKIKALLLFLTLVYTPIAYTMKLTENYGKLIKNLGVFKELKQDIIDQNDKVQDKKIELSNIAKDVVGSYKKIGKTKQTKYFVEISIKNLENEIKTISKDQELTKTRIAKLEKDKANLENEKANLENKRNKLKKYGSTLAAEKTNLASTITQKQKEKVETENKVRNKEQEIKIIQDKLDGKIKTKIKYDKSFWHPFDKITFEVKLYDNGGISRRTDKWHGSSWDDKYQQTGEPRDGEIEIFLK